MTTISETLLNWYQDNKRDLPWRKNKNAYYIWVSEIMLQQTRVEAVKPYFQKFILTLPTIESLSLVGEDALLKLWEGLGYYSRVRNMQKAAIICMDRYNGQLPTTYQELLTLPGIGPYTAGAIASIAYNQQVCAIDGNVLRVYARLFAIEKDILLQTTRNQIQAIMEQDLVQNMGDMNQALMDFGSSICIASGNVRCNICPLQSYCKAYQLGKVHQLPIRKKKKNRKTKKYTIVIYRYQNKVLLHKRKNQGLLARLYEFVTLNEHYSKKQFPHSYYLGKCTHVFSHIEWNMKGFLVEVDDLFEKDGYIWVEQEQLFTTYSIPGAFQKYLQKAFGGE